MGEIFKKSAEHRATIRALADKAFQHHVAKRVSNEHYLCKPLGPNGPEGSTFHWFRALLVPCRVIFTGDNPDAIFMISDHDPMHWIRGVHGHDSLDYYCGKIVALQGEKKVFSSADALGMLMDTGVSDTDRQVLDELKEFAGTPDGEDLTPQEFNERDWFDAWDNVPHGDEIPDVEEWSSNALWAYEQLRCFSRLLAEERIVT
jgi:hypothetical protein